MRSVPGPRSPSTAPIFLFLALVLSSLPLLAVHAQFRKPVFRGGHIEPVDLNSSFTWPAKASFTDRAVIRRQLADTTPRRRAHSTLAERFVAGFVLGSVMGVAAMQLAPDDGQTEIAGAGFVAGTTAGVFLAIKKREGFRAPGVLAGATLGMLPVLIGRKQGYCVGCFVALIAIPLLGALGNEIVLC